MPRHYVQLDVFASRPGAGNPLAVVLDATGLDDAAMQAIARWTRVPETTFVFPAQSGDASYGIRIFSPRREVPFAGPPQAALQTAGPGQAPDILLLDVRMGDFHGPTLYPELCARWRRSPPVILVIAEHDDALRREAAAQGWGFLSKPVRAPALRALMSQVLLRHR